MASPGLQLQVIPANGNNAIINVGDYTFTIYKSAGANWKDITSGKNWQELKATILDVFSEMVEKKTLQSGRMYLDGDFSDLETPTLRERDLTFVSAEAKYLDGADTKSKSINNLDEIPDPAKQTVRDKLTQLGKDFAKIRPVSSSQNRDEYEEIDPRIEICKDRPKNIVRDHGEKPQLNYALADHLVHLPDFDPVGSTPTDIKADIETHLKRNKDTVFTNLRDHLIQAHGNDQATFTKAIQTNSAKFNKFANLNTMRSSDIAQNANDLIELFVAYIHEGGTFGNELYLRAFSEKSGTGIVLIEEENGVRRAKSAFPLNQREMNSKNCVFVHLNKQTGKYSTFERGRPTDLDRPGILVKSSIELRKKRAASPVPTLPANYFVDLGNNGQCLDKSIAYQILKRRNMANNDVELNNTAKRLRTEAANVLRTDLTLDTDEDFARVLVKSIRDIPNLATLNQAIHTILSNEGNYQGASPLHVANRRLLREFYAGYITVENNASGRIEMNYLDTAFLYVLPKIPEGVFGYKVRCAVVQGTDVTAKFPPKEELTTQSIFVYYNGTNHYVAFNTNLDVVGEFERMIQRERERILLEFCELIGNDGNVPVKTRLLELKTQHPKAFNAFASLVYEHDHAAWERSDRQMPEPKDSGLPRNPHNFPYGEWRVNDASNADLKRILRTYSLEQIRNKISLIR